MNKKGILMLGILQILSIASSVGVMAQTYHRNSQLIQISEQALADRDKYRNREIAVEQRSNAIVEHEKELIEIIKKVLLLVKDIPNQQDMFVLNKQLKELLELKLNLLSKKSAESNNTGEQNTHQINVEVVELNYEWLNYLKQSPYLANLGQVSLLEILTLRKLQVQSAESPEQAAFLIKTLDRDMQQASQEFEDFKKQYAAKHSGKSESNGDS